MRLTQLEIGHFGLYLPKLEFWLIDGALVSNIGPGYCTAGTGWVTIWADKQLQYVTSHLGKLSLATPS